MEEVLGQIELLALILACLPMSKQKLRLQLVSKTWKAVLEDPAAHSCKTQDCELPFAGMGVSGKVTQVLSQCTATAYCRERDRDRKCAGWLGPDLQMLTLVFDKRAIPLHVLESLPIMNRLSHLHLCSGDIPNMEVSDREICQFDLSKRFPNLNNLVWESLGGEVFYHLEKLTKLQRCQFNMSESWVYIIANRELGVVNTLPTGCEVVWTSFGLISPFPAGLVSQITSIEVVFCCSETHWENMRLDDRPILDFRLFAWSSLSEATSLKSFRFECTEGDDEQAIILRNLGVFPRSCKTLEFICKDLEVRMSEIADNGYVFEDMGRSFRSRKGYRKWVLTRA